MKILLIHCHYRLPGGEDAVFAAERTLLEQHGHTVVVYEKDDAIGGLMRYGIPNFKLDKRLIDRRIKRLRRCCPFAPSGTAGPPATCGIS